MNQRRQDLLFWSCLSAAVLASRLCHLNLLWADEDYHLAAAIQTLHGKLPYRDFWYDKPPLNLAFYLSFGARTGWALRVADALFVCLCCALAYRFASQLFLGVGGSPRRGSRREGYAAAAAMAFFLIFDQPPGVLPLEPDTLMLAPHLAAVYLAWRRKPFLAGLAAGIAFQLNVRGVFVLLFAALFVPAGAPMLLVGFLAPNAIVLAWLAANGALADYWAQVWKWGWLYARHASAARPGIASLAGWLGFHAALVLAATLYWLQERSRTLAWFLLALIFTVAGFTFAPRYFNLLLPALVLPAARGFQNARPFAVACLLIALAVPAIRFGPRYVQLAREDLARTPHAWRDVAMDEESRQAAAIVRSQARPGDTIFIWGYRPDIVAYTRLPVAGRLWDSQPLTGVPADRHLHEARPVDEDWARQNRQDLARTTPTFLVDGLSRYNPNLDLRGYPDLAAWLKPYCESGRAGSTIVYQRCDAAGR